MEKKAFLCVSLKYYGDIFTKAMTKLGLIFFLKAEGLCVDYVILQCTIPAEGPCGPVLYHIWLYL